MPPRILLIEDDPAFRKAVAGILKLNGFDSSEAGSGKAGVCLARAEKPELVILDLVMPGLGGLEVCQRLKQDPETASIPILILTGNDREGQDVACLDMGADDYLTKPVKAERLLAYCRALLRRSRPETPQPQDVRVGDLRLDYGRKTVAMKGKEFSHLTPKEFGLLYELACRSPEPEDRVALYERVWGISPPSESSLKTVDVHVRRIRLKLGWTSDRWLVSVTGRGYCVRVPAKG
ncbi:MAG TPA: DNA-binding response regulator [Elusimicrobia bacterium]|nr:DNA-binding response regulator [Elusimicrobiota bacterium]HBT62360.1 DNA-binding response regulator [Elusimicrobiota bacterium]